MAVKETPARYKGFTFDSVDSKDYGVYIQDGGMFDAPARDVEMVEIPGRNGAYALDKGRFENVTLTYQAFIPQDSETDFATAIQDFRNQLASRKGYCRLEDEFNADEYRLAVFKDGLSIDNVSPKVGTFDVVFDCKPQRFLTSGETAISVNSGDAITNPTLFSASPLLVTNGYGSIYINNDPIAIQPGAIGDVYINTGTNTYWPIYAEITVNDALYASGDTITVSKVAAQFRAQGVAITSGSGDASGNHTDTTVEMAGVTFTAGTSETKYYTLTIDYNGNTVTVPFFVAYFGAGIIRYGINVGYGTGIALDPLLSNDTVMANSSITVFNEYIDLETGNAYVIAGGKTISINNLALLPASLPTLAPGANTVTYDNTINSLQLIPRWWKV